MHTDLLNAIDAATARARKTGTLRPIRTERVFVETRGLRFMVSWVASLHAKDAARIDEAARRGPAGSPFLPPEADLSVGAYGDTHRLVLNKYPVLPRHLLIVTRNFEAQSDPLTAADFQALASVMHENGGLGFYNGGEAAGASQRHKHLQWLPALPEGLGIGAFAPEDAAFSPTCNAALPWRHCFVALDRHDDMDAAALGAHLCEAFKQACAALTLDPDQQPMRPYNLLVSPSWLLVVPRSRERYEGISVNALGFAASLFVRDPAQIETVRRMGPLSLLTHVATTAATGAEERPHCG